MIKNVTAEETFINLVRSVINNEKPEALPNGIAVDELYEIGYKQKMVPMILCALNMINPRPASDHWEKYITLLSAGCMNGETQMQEYHKLVAYLCGNGVKLIPLKGCVINGLYPSAGLRTMSDVDLLYAGVGAGELAGLMGAFGYVTDNLDRGCHDTFHNENGVNVELHRKLIRDDSPYKPVLDGIFDRAVSDGETANLYYMKPEDLYVHVIVHAARHFEASGLGLRPLVDIYLLNRRYENGWDRAHIDGQLERVRLHVFESKLYGLAQAFFGDEPGEVAEEDIRFLFRAGLYGVDQDPAWDYMRRGGRSKATYLLKRTFLPYSRMREMFPVLVKCPVLLPAAWLRRIYDVLLYRKQNLVRVATARVNGENAEYAARVNASFGLGS